MRNNNTVELSKEDMDVNATKDSSIVTEMAAHSYEYTLNCIPFDLAEVFFSLNNIMTESTERQTVQKDFFETKAATNATTLPANTSSKETASLIDGEYTFIRTSSTKEEYSEIYNQITEFLTAPNEQELLEEVKSINTDKITLNYPTSSLNIQGHKIENSFIKKSSSTVTEMAAHLYEYSLNCIPFDLTDVFFSLNNMMRENMHEIINNTSATIPEPKDEMNSALKEPLVASNAECEKATALTERQPVQKAYFEAKAAARSASTPLANTSSKEKVSFIDGEDTFTRTSSTKEEYSEIYKKITECHFSPNENSEKATALTERQPMQKAYFEAKSVTRSNASTPPANTSSEETKRNNEPKIL
jgi:hypothetical protein